MEKNEIPEIEFTVDENYYFWLGEDGEATPVTGEEFVSKVEEAAEEQERFLNVR